MECDVRMTMEMVRVIVRPELYDKYQKIALFDFISVSKTYVLSRVMVLSLVS